MAGLNQLPFLAAVLLASTGCHSWYQVPPQNLVPTSEPATVRVTLGRGDVLVLQQARVQGDTLIGRQITGHRTGVNSEGREVRQILFRVLRVPFQEIITLEIRRFDRGKTVGRSIAVGIPLALLVVTLSGELLDRRGATR